MSSILEYLFSSAAIWLWVLLALAAAAAAYAFHGRSFALTDFTYTFPLIGKIARFSRDYSEREPGWLNVEYTLCRDYACHVTSLSPDEFTNNAEYLRKAFDHGRRPIPVWALAVLTILVAMEGLGFSYLLGALINPEASEYVRNWLMFGVVAVLAAILVWVMHSAGHQLYRTNLLRNCFREFQARSREEKDSEATEFASRTTSLHEDQNIDDSDPEYVQGANRVITKPGDLGSYSWIWLAILLMMVFAVGSTLLRFETLQAAETSAPSFAGLFEVGSTETNAPPPPPADSAARRIANLTGFTMLAAIFIVTQLVGMGVGYWYGFASKQGKEAFQATGGAADYKAYFAPIERRMKIANLRLQTLQWRLEKRSTKPMTFKHDFYDFVRKEQDRGHVDLHLPINIHKRGNGAASAEDERELRRATKQEGGQAAAGGRGGSAERGSRTRRQAGGNPAVDDAGAAQ